MIVLGIYSVGGSRTAAVALVPTALFWPLIDQQIEGPTLLVISYSHGITVADLLCPIALLAAGVCWSVAFILYAVTYAPYLWRPRVDGREG